MYIQERMKAAKKQGKKKIEIHLPYLCEQRQRENARRNYFQESVLCSIFKATFKDISSVSLSSKMQRHLYASVKLNQNQPH